MRLRSMLFSLAFGLLIFSPQAWSKGNKQLAWRISDVVTLTGPLALLRGKVGDLIFLNYYAPYDDNWGICVELSKISPLSSDENVTLTDKFFKARCDVYPNSGEQTLSYGYSEEIYSTPPRWWRSVHIWISANENGIPVLHIERESRKSVWETSSEVYVLEPINKRPARH